MQEGIIPATEHHVGTVAATDCAGSGCPGCADCLGGHGAPWSRGLRQLYQSVVSEPLPESFADLLRQRDVLLEAASKTIEENGHLADWEVCTLIHLKRGIESATTKGAA